MIIERVQLEMGGDTDILLLGAMTDTELASQPATPEGWDPVPRATEFEVLDGEKDPITQRVRIPAGHIAIVGDF